MQATQTVLKSEPPPKNRHLNLSNSNSRSTCQNFVGHGYSSTPLSVSKWVAPPPVSSAECDVAADAGAPSSHTTGIGFSSDTRLFPPRTRIAIS